MDEIANTTFRIATPNDFQRVSAQIAKSYKATYQDTMDRAYLDSLNSDHWISILHDGYIRGDTCIILEINDQIMGSVVYGRSSIEPNGADWHAIYLSERCIGKGLGHQLYCKMEETMRTQKYRSSMLEVLTNNHRAIQFYLSHGYSVTNTFIVEENGMVLECYSMKKMLL